VVESGRSGTLTAPDREEFAAAVIKLLGDAEGRSRMGVCARDRAGEFSVARSTDKLCHVYDEVWRARGEPG
jgi:glycosyltransferase involved in cell wall biosynthesis